MRIGAVTVDPLTTTDTTPELTGTVTGSAVTISLNVAGKDYLATESGNDTWTLVGGTDALVEGTYEVTVTATDVDGHSGTDGTTLELVITAT